jgi:hypothetical protein
MAGKPRRARFLERDVVIAIEVVDAEDRHAGIESFRATCMPMKPAQPVTQHAAHRRSPLTRERPQLRVFHEAREAADRDVTSPAMPSRKPSLTT